MKKILTIAAAAAVSLSAMAQDKPIDYTVDRFADIEVLRYDVPDFNSLSLNQKRLVYYLTEAAIWGRDILWAQNYKHNLEIRDLIENLYTNYAGDRNSEQFKAFEKIPQAGRICQRHTPPLLKRQVHPRLHSGMV